jgi:AraC-like DNA-binding protein
LNRARRLLRAGEPIAAVAAETGFADQSHLGRLFRRTFGTTPGAYCRL